MSRVTHVKRHESHPHVENKLIAEHILKCHDLYRISKHANDPANTLFKGQKEKKKKGRKKTKKLMKMRNLTYRTVLISLAGEEIYVGVYHILGPPNGFVLLFMKLVWPHGCSLYYYLVLVYLFFSLFTCLCLYYFCFS
jgi:hypothetical protein